MNVTFHCLGLTFTAECDFTPYDPGVCSGPVENCYPPEGGTAEITELKCGDDDAMFLLKSDHASDLEDAAYDACCKAIEREAEEDACDRYRERILDREYA